MQQLSVYASQRRLCITAAVANAFQEVQEGLLLLTRPKAKSVAADLAPAAKVYLLHMPWVHSTEPTMDCTDHISFVTANPLQKS